MRIGQTSIVNFLSQIATSIFGFVVTVYLARELGDAVLGNYFLVVAVLVWLKVLGGQGIQMAIRKRVSEGESEAAFFGAGLTLQLVAFVVLAGAILVFRGPVNDYLRTDAALGLIALLATGLLVWQVRAAIEGRHRVALSSLLGPFDRTARGALQIGVVVVGLGTVGWLLAGYAVAELLTGLVGLSLLAIRPRLPTRKHLRSLLGYAKYSWFSGIESRTFASMDTLVLAIPAFAISSGQIGVYEVAWNLASVLAVFGASVSTTLFPAISKLSSAGEDGIDGLIDDAVAYSGLFVIPGFVGCVVVGRRVLAIYGAEFTRGYTILLVLVAARLLYVYQSQFTNVLAAIDRPDSAFRINVTFVATNLVLNVALVALVGWLGAAVATATSATVGLVLSYWYLQKYVTIPIPIGELASQAFAAVAMGVVVFVGRGFAGAGVAWTVALVAVGGGAYFATLTVLSRRFRATVRRNLPIPS
ncbi:oligosaccharide flippase family protein [Halococcus sediminicola]|uniref:oligosaccharide flippase family protein n=1 Tax=Halococcus sediminicola TaxID=1264579 RepID=UPI0006787C87|nr:lipopolysaccharide biosynthesis protein [Halococcus sediminicola]